MESFDDKIMNFIFHIYQYRKIDQSLLFFFFLITLARVNEIG